jgi:hypothetical protein
MMRGIVAALVFCTPLLVAAWAAEPLKQPPPTAPKQAVGDFTSSNYAITFKAPSHAYYCPLPDGWEGSDHGTVVFLTTPKACYGAGYPSSGRGFEPADTPRIEVFYGYDLDDSEDGHKPPSCHESGTALLLGKAVPLCRDTKGGLAIITAEGRYVADQPAMLSVTLVVSPADLPRFLPTFKGVLASMHPCRDRWEASDLHGKIVKSGYIGHGPACPSGQWY